MILCNLLESLKERLRITVAIVWEENHASRSHFKRVFKLLLFVDLNSGEWSSILPCFKISKAWFSLEYKSFTEITECNNTILMCSELLSALTGSHIIQIVSICLNKSLEHFKKFVLPLIVSDISQRQTTIKLPISKISTRLNIIGLWDYLSIDPSH